MTIPSQTFTLNDPGLATTSPGTTIPLFLGIAESGTAASMFTGTSPSAILAEFGHGPMPEAAALCCQRAGGPVRCMRVAQSAAGTLVTSPLTNVGGGPAITNNVSVPLDAYEVYIEIVAAGALGVGTFKWSLDNGRTFSAALTLPAGGTYDIPDSGVKLTLAVGAYLAGATYVTETTAPVYTTVELATASTAVVAAAGTDPFDFVVLCGRHATAAAANTLAGGLVSLLDDLEIAFRVCPAMMSAGEDNAADTKTDFTEEDHRLLPAYGSADRNTALPVTGWGTPSTPVLHEFAWKAARELLSTDLARVASGSLTGIAGPSATHGNPLSHDEFVEDNMDSDGFATLRTWYGLSGVYITNGRVKCGATSDYQHWQYTRIMDQALQVVYAGQTALSSASFRVNADGTIDERDAAAAEAKIQRALEILLLEPKNAEGTYGHVSAVTYTIDRTNNFGESSILQTELAIRPRGYAKWITTEAGFQMS